MNYNYLMGFTGRRKGETPRRRLPFEITGFKKCASAFYANSGKRKLGGSGRVQ